MTSKKPSGLVTGPDAVDVLRQIALHRETARLLQLRADRERSQPAADLLHHRAAQRRGRADALAASLHLLSTGSRRPSAQA